jgi:hypothetical protein
MSDHIYFSDHYGRWCNESLNDFGNVRRILLPSAYKRHIQPLYKPNGLAYCVRLSWNREAVFKLEDIGYEPDGTYVLAWIFVEERECEPPEPVYSDELLQKLKALEP